jgi:hypothetical protein
MLAALDCRCLVGSFLASSPAAIEAGVDARDRAALMLRGPAKAPTKHRSGEHNHRQNRRDHD